MKKGDSKAWDTFWDACLLDGADDALELVEKVLEGQARRLETQMVGDREEPVDIIDRCLAHVRDARGEMYAIDTVTRRRMWDMTHGKEDDDDDDDSE